MAMLLATELAALRNRLERMQTSIAYAKPQINAALQAIEDVMTTQTIPVAAVGATVPQYLSTRIDNATTPFVFSMEQKKRLFAFWSELKFRRDG